MGGATATSMTGQPDSPQYYAVEQLREAQKRLLDLSQSLVIWRARVEKYRTTDRAAAKVALESTRPVSLPENSGTACWASIS